MDRSAARGMLSCNPAQAARRSDPVLHRSRSSSAPTRRRWPRICSRASWSVAVTADSLRRGRALAAEVILEPDDVVELGRGDLDELARLDGLVSVDAPCPDVRTFARPELAILDHARLVLEGQQQATVQDVDPFVLDLVVLQREPLSGLDHEELPDVPFGPGPDELVAPGLVDSARQLRLGRRGRRPVRHVARFGAHPRTSLSPAPISASCASVEVASVYTRTSGSVPEVRMSSQDPSSTKNLKPSLVESDCVRVTGEPARSVGGVETSPSSNRRLVSGYAARSTWTSTRR